MANVNNERLYHIWNLMKQRCCNPNRKDYEWYGAKGISVCEEWLEYNGFKQWAVEHGYNEKLTLDRKNSRENYTPDNCRWIPFSQQRENTTQTRLVTIGGRTQCLKYWCRELGINYDMVCMRIHRGVRQEDALMLPRGARLKR